MGTVCLSRRYGNLASDATFLGRRSGEEVLLIYFTLLTFDEVSNSLFDFDLVLIINRQIRLRLKFVDDYMFFLLWLAINDFESHTNFP